MSSRNLRPEVAWLPVPPAATSLCSCALVAPPCLVTCAVVAVSRVTTTECRMAARRTPSM
eukprot:scaffold38660_cov46-Phaeocystis_antarctica.AAC.2